jgi:uncharacterized Zn finger protein
MKFDCDCPDWAGMCKHVAAVLYGVGARLDHSPEMLFLLRGVNHEELIDVTAAVAGVTKSGTSRRRIATTGLADVFGVDMAEASEEIIPPAISAKKSKISIKIDTKPAPALQKAKKKAPVNSKGDKKNSTTHLFPDPITGDSIYNWRASLGETQAAFANRINRSTGIVGQWEKKGKNTVGVQARTLARLRRAWEQTH